MMKAYYKVLATTVLLSSLLVACGSTESGTTNGSAPANTEVDSNKPEDKTNDKSSKETKENKDTKTEGSSSQKLAANIDIEVFVEGGNELRPATLSMSENGYAVYVLEDFTFEAEEPNKDIIHSNFDPEYFVRIEKLDAEANTEEMKKNIMSAYEGNKQIGIHDVPPTDLFIEEFHNADFHILIQDLQTKLDVIYIVSDMHGEKFQFTFFMPHKEAAEGVAPSLWAIARTVIPTGDGLK
ncbi:hypothetical protein [Cytobacillus luteolus]|nr:hypothetical protein [Cytobacillus luteolus]